MSGKFEHDKYYTPDSVVVKCMEVLKECVDVGSIDTVVEPSAGGGAFIPSIEEIFPQSNKIYLDLYPENSKIVEQDYLEFQYEKELNEKVLVLGNPPFGSRNNLARKFFNISAGYADYIAFILPISQYENVASLYQFDLIRSEDLGLVPFYFEGEIREVRCCFNVYKRPLVGLNKKKVYKFEEVMVREVITRSRVGRETKGLYSEEEAADKGVIRLRSWGDISLVDSSQPYYASEIHVTSSDEGIVEFVRGFDWGCVASKTATPSLNPWRVYEELLKRFDLTPVK